MNKVEGKTMQSTHPNRDEIAKLGREIYDRQIRSQVEVAENIGKIVSINVETCEYEVGEDLVETSLRSQAKYPHALLWAERIGYDAVYAVGGTIVKTVTRSVNEIL
jgi:hypothetical protein